MKAYVIAPIDAPTGHPNFGGASYQGFVLLGTVGTKPNRFGLYCVSGTADEIGYLKARPGVRHVADRTTENETWVEENKTAKTTTVNLLNTFLQGLGFQPVTGAALTERQLLEQIMDRFSSKGRVEDFDVEDPEIVNPTGVL